MRELIVTLKGDNQKEAIKNFFKAHPHQTSQMFDLILINGNTKNRFIKMNDAKDFRKYNYCTPTKWQKIFANDKAIYLNDGALSEEDIQHLKQESEKLLNFIQETKKVLI